MKIKSPFVKTKRASGYGGNLIEDFLKKILKKCVPHRNEGHLILMTNFTHFLR